MIERTAYHMELKGSNCEIGRALGNIALSVPELADMQRLPGPVLSKEEQAKMFGLFDRFCPGINEEVGAFAEVLKIPAGRVFYYLMSYLQPGCSQMVVLPSISMDGHLRLARNYDFSDQFEEMTLYTTRIKGRYAHIGSSSLQFGRGDGMNERGLAVSQSSAGFPVGNLEFARKPAITGLQYWAIIRSVLENCRDVEDAVNLTKEMPIACNMNLLVADRSGNAALIESFDGHKAVKRINADTEEQFICATNHLHLPELIYHDPNSMENSIHRYKLITGTLSSKDKLKKEDLKGLCYSYFHFHRVFEAVLGETVGNYLRSRRLTKAAHDLVYTDKRILDISLDYWFESQESFNRAFKKTYQVTPGTFRKNRMDIVLFNKKPLTRYKLEHLHTKITVQPEIREIGDVKLIGVRGKTTLRNNMIPKMWQLFNPRIGEIKNRTKRVRGYGVNEVDPDFDFTKFNEDMEFSVLVGVEVRRFTDIPQGMVAKTLAGGKYAVFTHKGTLDTLRITYDYIWGTWLSCCGYDVDLRDDFEFYDERFLGPDNEESVMSIYIPLK